ncbi:MAG: TonB-dependent receptor [Bacteroidales bacterium]|jgi:iron complex outermembrane receptor protein
MNRSFIPAAFSILIGTLSQVVSGQNSNNDTINYKNIGEVLVTAYRISSPLKVNPGAVSVVSTPVLLTMPRTIAVDEALRLVPGVRIDNQADGSRIHLSIRGQGILSEHGLRGIKVLIDGIPVNDPSGFAPDLYDIDWSAVSRIEVLRGPAASLYGGGSNAGILNIKTPDGGEKKFNGTFFTSAGSNGFFKVMGQADGSYDKIKYRIDYSNFGGDGYRYHTAFRGSVLSDKLTWQAGENVKITQILIVSHYFNKNAEGLNLSQLDNPRQANPDAIPYNEYQDTKRVTNGLLADFRLSGNQNIQVSGYLKVTSYMEPGSSDVQYSQFITPGSSVQYNLNSGPGSLKNHLSAGFDCQFQSIEEYKVPNIKDSTRTEEIGDISRAITEGNTLLANQTIDQGSYGVFAIDRLEFGPRLNSVFSIRYDNISNKLTDKMDTPDPLSGSAAFQHVSARLGLSYNLSDQLNLYANAGQGFLPPSTEELTSNPESYGGFNPDLKPATSLGEEAGLRGYLLNSLYYDVTLFYLDTKNDFYRYRVPARPLETFYGNAGSSRRKGAELYINWSPVKELAVQLAYTYSDFRYTSPDSISGNRLPNSPAHQLFADVGYKIGKHVSFGISYEMQSRWYIYTDSVHSNIYQEGFSLIHARVSYDFKIGEMRGSVSLYGKNLGNKQYVAFTEPDPDGNSYQPSARREVFASLKLLF